MYASNESLYIAEVHLYFDCSLCFLLHAHFVTIAFVGLAFVLRSRLYRESFSCGLRPKLGMSNYALRLLPKEKNMESPKTSLALYHTSFISLLDCFVVLVIIMKCK